MREIAGPCEPGIRLVPAAHGTGYFFLLVLVLVFLLRLRLGAPVTSGAANAPAARSSSALRSGPAQMRFATQRLQHQCQPPHHLPITGVTVTE